MEIERTGPSDKTERAEQPRQRTHARHAIAEASKLGYRLLRNHDLAGAEQQFRTILEEEPDNHYALVGLGDALRRQRRLPEAISAYRRCIHAHPDNNYAIFGLAESYSAAGQYRRATRVWNAYLRHESDNVTILSRVAEAYRKAGDFDNAMHYYRRVLAIEPNNPYALIGLGHLYYDFHRYDESLVYWQRIQRNQEPRVDIRVLTSLGNCFRKLKRFEEGERIFVRALELEPENFYALYGLADCLRGEGQFDGALRYWMQLSQMAPDNRVVLTRTGDAYRALGDLASARGRYEAALSLADDPFAAIGLSVVDREEGHLMDAVDRLQRLIAKDVKNARGYIELIRCYRAEGDEEAITAVVKQANLAGVDIEAYPRGHHDHDDHDYP